MFAQLNGENGNSLNMLNNERGNFYVPNRNFNNIPFWNQTEGYNAEMIEERVVSWEGDRIPVNTVVTITRGWNYIAYIPTYELNASAPDFGVISPIVDHLICAIDGAGGFMIPEFEFSNMAPWSEGHGYMVNVNQDVELVYPEEGARGADLWHPLVGEHWDFTFSKYVMPLLVEEIQGGDPSDGDMIAAYSRADVLVGCGTVQELRCGVTLWGDNPDTQERDGLRAGEDFRLVYWISGEDREVDAEIVDVLAGDAVFSVGALSVMSISADIGEQAQRQVIHFNQGWNLISINLSPPQEFWRRDEGPDVMALFRPQWFQDQQWLHPNMMKDERGRFWVPNRELCMIPYWNLAEGYLVLVDEANDVTIVGELIPPNSDVPITTGWNMISYFPEYELEASSPDFYALSPIIDHVIIAKNMQGQFMLPQRRFSNMAPWQSGNGYQIRVDADVVLNYPSERNQGAATESPTPGTHWNFEPTGFQNMSLLITDVTGVKLASGDQIAAFDANGALVGVGDVVNGMCGLALWGKLNESTSGLAEGGTFELKLWREASGVESHLTLPDRIVYHTDGFAIASAQVTTLVPSEVALNGCFPNPFNGTTRIGFDLTETCEVALTAINLSGQEVSRILQGRLEAGHHSSIWQASDLPTGIYLIRLETAGKSQTMKTMLIK